MALYSPNQIRQRDTIIQSQKQFWNFLDSNMINKLIHLFDTPTKIPKSTMSKYIENARKEKALNTSNVSVNSYVYGQKESKPSLGLEIKKNNKKFIHLSIHLAPGSLKPTDNGPIHFSKNIYRIIGTNSKQDSGNRKLIYAIILVSQPADKPRSLEFSIATGYTTPGVENPIYDHELQQEMNVIITVLNRLFDENNAEFYIGNEDKLFPIHNNTNIVLDGINKISKIVSLKNKGTRLYPPLNKNSESISKYRLNKKSQTRVNKSARGKRRTPIIIYENNFKISMI